MTKTCARHRKKTNSDPASRDKMLAIALANAGWMTGKPRLTKAAETNNLSHAMEGISIPVTDPPNSSYDIYPY
jgi:hypothetical protein